MILNKREWRTLDCKTWSIIEYKLTIREFIQAKGAFVKAWWNGGCIADYLNPELENVLCGYVPERHTIVEPYVDDVEKDEK